jgi:putative FmdB family regulatory protein
MPIYGYVCKDCKSKFDLLVGVLFQKAELKCEKCGSKNIEKLFGTFSVGGSGDTSNSSGGSCPTGTCTTSF